MPDSKHNTPEQHLQIQLRSAREESEVRLLQLRQVQEELQHYIQVYQQAEQQIQQYRQDQKRAQVLIEALLARIEARGIS